MAIDIEGAEMTEPGNVFKYGDSVNTDVIFPGKYTYTITEAAEMAAHAMEDLDPEFAAKAKRGDFVVAGKNFGCGSSREQAATCLVEIGIRAVVAKSFARIYFRNAINLGLPVIVCPEAVDAAKSGSKMSADFEKGVIQVDGNEFAYSPFPEQVREILASGGLLNYAKTKLQAPA